MSQDLLDRLNLSVVEESEAEHVAGGILGSAEYFLVNPAGTVLNRTVLSGLFNSAS